MATHETRYSVKIGLQSVSDMASSATCYLLVSNLEKSLDHESGGRRGSQTVGRLWPITYVLHLRTQLVKVQFCFVRASPYCYFLLFAVWLQLWRKLFYKLTANQRRQLKKWSGSLTFLTGPTYFLRYD